ncbi:SDR family NAD(P)-dependent oxidoreductase [Oricola cellulosilytica]|uniref:SDR family NAD(P)-dependent oxidoreductase n=1 Tax=Oricola cellulosilytica TaxID=1429082 RepID=UPI00130501FC|nr:SDR family NAD(P)-dependent oxidoreductase [Oricola cellulosilytica]
MSGERRALVTGGGGGLGRGFCEVLSTEGWRVTNLDRRNPDRHADVEHIACDLGDRGDVDLILPSLIAAGPWDLVVFNAGIPASGTFKTIPFEAQRRVITATAETPLVLCAGLAGAGALAQGGTVLFISSLSHYTGYLGAATHAAARGAIAAYARSIRQSFRHDIGVAVACAFPDPVRMGKAARHVSAGGDAKSGVVCEDAARLILNDAARGKAVILPGARSKLSALAGLLLPQPVARAMRRVTHDNPDRDVG